MKRHPRRSRRPHVRVGPGCTQGDVDHATHAFGLAVPAGIVSTTGIAGLTLARRPRLPARKHGLTIDNLLEADVVLADGSFVTASADSHPDLFWALRGGGGNFGVVTSFLFRAHPVGTVFAGPVAWDIAEAPQHHAALPRLAAAVARGAQRLPRAEDGALDRSLPARALGQAHLPADDLLRRPRGRPAAPRCAD